MNKILNARIENESGQMEAVAACYPEENRLELREALQAVEDEDYEKAAELCCRLLDVQPVPEVCELLGNICFLQGNIMTARIVFSDLTEGYPETEKYRIQLGIAEHALGNCKRAVELFAPLYPLKTYRPFYYNSYGDSLLKLGKAKESREVFYQEALRFKNTGNIPSAEMLDGTFQNLLYLDVQLINGKYPEDVSLYYKFLEQVEMTESMQKCLGADLAYWSTLMHNRWYRPLFLELITYVKERGYLKTEESQEVLKSAFASWESYSYHDDPNINGLLERYLSAYYERNYLESADQEEAARAEAIALTYEWYMCQYQKSHPEALSYIKEAYPYTYADNREFLEKLECDPKKAEAEIRGSLSGYVKESDKEVLAQSLERAYRREKDEGKKQLDLSDGVNPYRKIQPKIGRNDPCPCGSGKKYKKCCGR